MIRKSGNDYLINTRDTSYCFHVMPSGHPEHIYYGAKLLSDDVTDTDLKRSYSAMVEKKEFPVGNSVVYSDEYPEVSFEDVALEISAFGKGDVREPSIIIISHEGYTTSDPVFVKSEIIQGTAYKKGLPGSHGECESLIIKLYDSYSDSDIRLYYTVFYDCNVITRSVSVHNRGEHDIRIEKIMSLTIDLYGTGLRYTDFCGQWAREMHKDSGILKSGSHVISSRTGTSSSRCNPLFIISDPEASEDHGDVYGFNLIYSGDHYESMSVGSFDKTRFMTGINPEGSSFLLKSGDSFYSPEACMTYSASGFTKLSHNFHSFVKRHIIPERFKDTKRPVLINSWEANYFDFDEESLVKQAEAARDAGIELFVMDDGWFGRRDDDHSSLGDWKVYKEKLPGGLRGLSDRIHELGLSFGIWIEPEMINEDSDLFREHPDYAVRIPGHTHSKGRDQLILDLPRREVTDNITGQLKEVLSSCRIEYVKWDMNRVFSDRFSPALKPRDQGEFLHRYVLGLYRIMDELTKAFPDILFEGCSAGGNRFDLGILSYFPQIWGSDDTDAIERIYIQEGYSYGYPLVTVGSHVSSVPNHQTMRCEPMETRFAVASSGAFGYELDLTKQTEKDKAEIKSQTEFYKKYRDTLQKGDYYRLNDEQWMIVSENKKTAIGFFIKKSLVPNKSLDVFRTKGLEPSFIYHVTNRVCDRASSDFGSLMEGDGPALIKGEIEDEICPGSVLNNCGIRLKHGYGNTGLNENTRIMKDMDARIYIFEAMPFGTR